MPRLSIPFPSHQRSRRRSTPSPLTPATSPPCSSESIGLLSSPVSSPKKALQPLDPTIYPSFCVDPFTVCDLSTIDAALRKSFGSRRTHADQEHPLGARDRELVSTGPLSPEEPPSSEDDEDEGYMWPEYFSPQVWDDPADSFEFDDIRFFDGTFDRDRDVVMGGS